MLTVKLSLISFIVQLKTFARVYDIYILLNGYSYLGQFFYKFIQKLKPINRIYNVMVMKVLLSLESSMTELIGNEM